MYNRETLGSQRVGWVCAMVCFGFYIGSAGVYYRGLNNYQYYLGGFLIISNYSIMGLKTLF